MAGRYLALLGLAALLSLRRPCGLRRVPGSWFVLAFGQAELAAVCRECGLGV
jgi:hypothetical protein